MFHLLKAIFSPASGSGGAEYDALVELAIDRAIDGTDPRVRAVGNHRRELREPVERAIAHVQSLMAAFHPPVELSRRRYGVDPQVRGMFGSPDQIDEVLAESRTLRDFVAEPGSALLEGIYAGMAMTRRDKRILAPNMRGDIVERDALRDTVNFSGHGIAIPSATESALMMALRERAYMSLVESALARLVAMRTRKQHLEKDRTILGRKLKTLAARGLDLQSIVRSDAAPGEGSPELESRLVAIEEELKEVTASVGTLEQSLDQIGAVLCEPAQSLRCTAASVRMTAMGFKTSPDAADPGSEVFYTEVEIGESESLVARLVRFPREALTPGDRG